MVVSFTEDMSVKSLLLFLKLYVIFNVTGFLGDIGVFSKSTTISIAPFLRCIVGSSALFLFIENTLGEIFSSGIVMV